MKKRYVVIAVFAIFLLLSISFAFAGVFDIWVRCLPGCSADVNKCTGVGNECCKVDENIFGTTDFCCTDGASYYWKSGQCCIDNDGDGYGNPAALECPYKTLDCDDANPAINPGATEVIADGIDQNCDGQELCHIDADDDGYRPYTINTVVSLDLDCLDSGEALSTDPLGDCDDTFDGKDKIVGNADDGVNINPAKTEICTDAIDNNCNQNNDNTWDALHDTGVDCKDLSCAGKPGKAGPSDVVCCQSSPDCGSLTTGNCGVSACTGNICDVTEDTSRCPGITGTCGNFTNKCTLQVDGSFNCGYVGINDLCVCGKTCGAGYSCTDVSCTLPGILDYCDEATSKTCAAPSYEIRPGVNSLGPQACIEQYPGLNNCVCYGCSTCPSTLTGGSGTIGTVIC